ncbi:exodeoxyribonuclease VII small subunit [Patescibacteria group bacterium]|nr:exodeoxyribonuclease VII small subunit [Patescibacteria group bacterium]MBU1448787.1 exodeoxyribonuclease VII small subunit [Patescibacteria group bacterium]MBU2613520.1 exodeoxyribonuclease VII small subunit [Patescibacteria group bacterium]
MPPKKDAKNIDVAKGFEELEGIAAWFEQGDGDLDEGLKKFERAMTLADALKTRLDAAENTVSEILKRFDASDD